MLQLLTLLKAAAPGPLLAIEHAAALEAHVQPPAAWALTALSPWLRCCLQRQRPSPDHVA